MRSASFAHGKKVYIMNTNEAEQYINILGQMRKSRRAWESGRFGQEDFEDPKNGATAPSTIVFTSRHPDYVDGDGNPLVWPGRVKGY